MLRYLFVYCVLPIVELKRPIVSQVMLVLCAIMSNVRKPRRIIRNSKFEIQYLKFEIRNSIS
jgi:hypothetical protein